MAPPTIEIAVFQIKGRSVKDESTQGGKTWHRVLSRVTQIPGFIRVGVGRRLDEPDTALFFVGKYSMRTVRFRSHLLRESRPYKSVLPQRTYLPRFFLSDWESFEHHKRFMEEKGSPFTPPLVDMLTSGVDMYHITPNTTARDSVYAPVTIVTYFFQPARPNSHRSPSSCSMLSARLTGAGD